VKKKSWINLIRDLAHPVIQSKNSLEAPHLKAGRWGEKRAERFLKKSGYKIIGRRVHCGKHDEIDLIARQDDTMVFVEVKTRKNENMGRPAAAVNRDKRRKLSRAAVTFLKKRKLRPPYIRFDIIEVIGAPDGDPPEIRHIENAFQMENGYRIWW
jgi:putative endonuclease